MRQMFVRMGCSNAASTDIVDEQGIDSLAELRFMDDSDISNLCRTVRRPGGQIDNPNAVAPAKLRLRAGHDLGRLRWGLRLDQTGGPETRRLQQGQRSSRVPLRPA